MTVIVLVILGVMVVAASVAPPPRSVRDDRAKAPQSAASPPLSDPDAFDVSATLSAAPGARKQTVAAEVGDRVLIRVEGDVLDSVALGDLEVEGLEAGQPARFELLADTPGRYPVMLVDAAREVGVLDVR
jgi:hypothetical protein